MTAACMIRFCGKAKDLKEFLAEVIKRIEELKEQGK